MSENNQEREQAQKPTAALPEFSQVEEVLGAANAYLEASELHGLLCGSVCHGRLQPDQEWLDVLLAETPREIFEQVELFVRQLFAVSTQQLTSDDFDFQLLLPEEPEDEPEKEVRENLLPQLAALGNWCEGFLLGMEFGQRQQKRKYSDAVKEALEDIAQTSRVYFKAVKSKEALDESALLECTEHVRVAVMLIYAELNNPKAQVKH